MRPLRASLASAGLTVVLLVGLTGCATRAEPKTALAAYLSAEQTGRYAAAHELLSSADQRARPLEAYVAEHLSAGPIWLAVAERTHFDLGRVHEADDHVVVDVRATHVVPEAVQEGLGPTPIARIEAAPDPAAAMRAWVGARIDAEPFPERTEALTYALREEDGAWRVWLALDRQDAAIAALQAARSADTAGDPAAARADHRAVLQVPPDPAGVVALLQDEARRWLEAHPSEPSPPSEASPGLAP